MGMIFLQALRTTTTQEGLDGVFQARTRVCDPTDGFEATGQD